MSRDLQVCFSAASLLLVYPEEELFERLDLIQAAVAETKVAPLFAPVFAHLKSGTLRDAQEFHVQEFDLSRRHALHLTYWTEGDTRRRGEALTGIKQVYRESGLLVDLDGELPDYIPMVLEFAASGDLELGLGILKDYRASLELLRFGLADDELPHEGVVEAVCRQLPGALAKSRIEIGERFGATYLDTPPIEQVGLQTYQITARPVS